MLKLYPLKRSASGVNLTNVPLGSSVGKSGVSVSSWARLNSARRAMPSRLAWMTNDELRALTALMPTPLSPTDFLNALLSYFAPVLMIEATSTSFPRGMPRP